MHLKEGTCLKCSFQRVVIIGSKVGLDYKTLGMHVCPWSGMSADDLLGPNCLQTLIAGRKSRERERARERETARCLHTNLFVLACFLEYRVSQSILLQLLPMRTQNPNLSCASAFVRQSRQRFAFFLPHAHMFKLTKHSILNAIPVWSGSKPCLQM